MVLQKDHNRVARWGVDKWVIEDKTIYRWADIKGKPITDWTSDFDQVLKYLIKSS